MITSLTNNTTCEDDILPNSSAHTTRRLSSHMMMCRAERVASSVTVQT